MQNIISMNGGKYIIYPNLLIQQENSRNLRQVGNIAFPLLHHARTHKFIIASKVCSNTQFCLRAAILYNILNHLAVAIRCLNKQLRLILIVNALFKLFELARTLLRLNRQIAVESKALPVEPRRHHRQKERGRRYPCERKEKRLPK